MTRRDIIKIIFIICVLALCVSLAGYIGKKQNTEETRIVKDAVREAVMTCYAVEGAYPDSVDYLREHYRLAYDENRYMVNLNAFATNRAPDIYVVEIGASE